MDIAALIVLIIGGVIGLWMLRYSLTSKHIPKGLALSHGLFVVSGYLLLLAYNLTTNNSHKHWQSFGIFSVAIPFGVYILYRDLIAKTKTRKLVILHALIGAAGIGSLFLHTVGGK
jgi:hypothetical protein